MSTWLAVCRSCHEWITENSKEAIELGLSDLRSKTEEHEI
jgi:predicted metal-binding protein